MKPDETGKRSQVVCLLDAAKMEDEVGRSWKQTGKEIGEENSMEKMAGEKSIGLVAGLVWEPRARPPGRRCARSTARVS